jgi:uncharacterized protein with HEPN domain
MRRDSERLLDILEAIGKIEKYAARGEEAFQTDELVQVWILYHLQIIGEAVYKLPRDFRTDHPEVAWNRYLSFRNILIHEYFGLDLKAAWEVVVNDLDPLKNQIESKYRAVESSEE